VSRPDIDQWR